MTILCMTLNYRTVNYIPPAKTGILVWGILTLIVAGFFVLIVAGSGIAFLFAARQQGIPAGVMLLVGLGYLVAAGLTGWLGVGMVTYRRWTRPVVLTVTGWAVVTYSAAIPLIALQQNPAIPFYLQLITSLGILVFCVLLPLSCFLYFRKAAVVETLNHFSPEPTWMDRWPVPVFAVGAIAIMMAICSLFSIGSMVVFGINHSATSALVSSGLQLLLAGLLALGGYTCFKNPMRGWTLVVTQVLLSALVGVLTILLAPELPLLAGKALSSQATTRAPATPPTASPGSPATGPAQVTTVQVSVGPGGASSPGLEGYMPSTAFMILGCVCGTAAYLIALLILYPHFKPQPQGAIAALPTNPDGVSTGAGGGEPLG